MTTQLPLRWDIIDHAKVRQHLQYILEKVIIAQSCSNHASSKNLDKAASIKKLATTLPTVLLQLFMWLYSSHYSYY